MVMDATSKFGGLGRGANLLYIRYPQLKGCGHGFLFRVHNAIVIFLVYIVISTMRLTAIQFVSSFPCCVCSPSLATFKFHILVLLKGM